MAKYPVSEMCIHVCESLAPKGHLPMALAIFLSQLSVNKCLRLQYLTCHIRIVTHSRVCGLICVLAYIMPSQSL